jgi:hypothetical protein
VGHPHRERGRLNCRDRQLAIIITSGADDDALPQLAGLNLDELPTPCVLRWHAGLRIWVASRR